MRFEVKVGNETIGYTELEAGDPPMGVAGGRFLPTAAYDSIQPHRIKHRDNWVAIPELSSAHLQACDLNAVVLFRLLTSALNLARRTFRLRSAESLSLPMRNSSLITWKPTKSSSDDVLALGGTRPVSANQAYAPDDHSLAGNFLRLRAHEIGFSR